MSEDYSEESSTGWLSRIVESIKGVLIGIVLALISFPLVAWNESRAVTTTRSLEEGGKDIRTIDPAKINPENENAFVHFTGLATTENTVEDKEFGVSLPKEIRLTRKVEMYQWKETKEEKTEKKLGGGTKTVTTYKYDKIWSESPIDSGAFNPNGTAAKEAEVKEKIANPAIPFKTAVFTAEKVTVGAFQLPKSLVKDISGDEAFPVSESMERPQGFEVVDKNFYKKAKPEAKESGPVVGDVRVSFTHRTPTEVSVYGKQYSSTLEGYTPKSGVPLIRLAMGTKSAQQMLHDAESENTVLTWILRVVGLVLLVLGIYLVFQPLVVVADVVPFIGNVLAAGAFAFALLLALPLWMLTIAVCWIAVRPVLGISLLVGAGAIITGVVLLRRKKTPASPPSPGR